MKRSGFLLSAIAASVAASIPPGILAAPARVIPREEFSFLRDWHAAVGQFHAGVNDGLREWHMKNQAKVGPVPFAIAQSHPYLAYCAYQIRIFGAEDEVTFHIRMPIDWYGNSICTDWHRVEGKPGEPGFREYMNGLNINAIGEKRELVLALAYANGRELVYNYRFSMEAVKAHDAAVSRALHLFQ